MPRHIKKLPKGVTFMVGAPPQGSPKLRNSFSWWYPFVLAAMMLAIELAVPHHSSTADPPAAPGTSASGTP